MRFTRGAVIADWKLFPIPRKNDLKYSRLCNFWRPMRGLNHKLKKWKHLKQNVALILPRPMKFTAKVKRSRFLLLQAVIVKKTLIIKLIKCSQLKLWKSQYQNSYSHPAIITVANRVMNQSQFLAITRKLLKAWGKWRAEDVIKFGSASHWLKKLGWDFSANL